MSIRKRIILRTALCGAQQVGKTSIMLRATNRKLPNKYVPTIGIDFGNYDCISNNMYVSIKMWDISGDMRFAMIAKKFFRDSSFVLFCFDMSRPETFETVKEYVKNVDKLAAGKNYTKCVVGIKSDISIIQNIEPFKTYSETINATYYEVDTSEEANVIFLMHSIAKDGVEGGNFDYDLDEEEDGDLIVQNGCPCM